MRILFLCGTLESGKCGGGDYTRRLAGELINQGHEIAICALMDKFVGTTTEEMQKTERTEVSVVRLPYANGFISNCKTAKLWVDNYDPEWISLQYGPFAFHDKGLPFGLGDSIQQLTKGRKLHIMFHELWVGMNREASFKLAYWGRMQRAMIHSFIKKVKPAVIHTQTKLYQLQLNKIGANVSLLPLFSNIKVAYSSPKLKDPNHLCFVVFGAIHSGAPIEAFAKEVSDYAIHKNLKVSFKFIGRCGKEQEHWASILDSFKLEVSILGELSEEIISKELSEASMGIVNTPLDLIEKSGANAAMKEHGLAVISLSHNWIPRGLKIDYDYQKRNQFRLGDVVNALNNKELDTGISLFNIAKSFLNRLKIQ
jgi:hypothetical protein